MWTGTVTSWAPLVVVLPILAAVVVAVVVLAAGIRVGMLLAPRVDARGKSDSQRVAPPGEALIRSAIGSPPPGQPMPLDWMLHSLHGWFANALAPFSVLTTVERVEGAWCPGFSDLAVSGRKLAGLGFRVTRDRVVMRGVMAVRPMSDADFDLLVRCHRLIGVELRRDSAVSLAEAGGAPDLDVDATIDAFRGVVS